MINLDYIAFLNETGYGQAAYDLISALLESKKYHIRISCLNGLPSKNFLSKERLERFEPLIRLPQNPNAIQVYHCIPPMQLRFPRTSRSIGFATFETYEPPTQWIEMLNRMDAVICPSEFNYKIFAHAGVKRPLFYVPHCIDSALWNEKTIALNRFEPYTFLFVGSWKRRKGWAELVEAYLREFDAQDKVQLLIKTDKSQLAFQDAEKIKKSLGIKKEYPPILFERRIFNEVSLPSFYKSADCFVMPTLGEGFGLPAMQCMAIKIPVIITDFSGCQEYASEENCTLIKPDGFMLHPVMDQIVQFSNKKWPRITIESIRIAMRSVFANQKIAQAKADKAYEYVHQKFSYKSVVGRFNKVMESIYSVS